VNIANFYWLALQEDREKWHLDGAWGWPYPHGAPDADGVACALLDRGVAGVLAAKLTLEFHPSLCPVRFPGLPRVGVDRTVLLICSFLISIFTGIIFGLASSFPGNEKRYDCRNSGKCSRLRLQPLRHSWLRSVLIVSELALAVVLMVGAGLLLRTLGIDSEKSGLQSFEGSHCKLLPAEPERSQDGCVVWRLLKRHLFSETSFGVWPRFQNRTGCHDSDLPGARPTTTAALVIEDRAAIHHKG